MLSTTGTSCARVYMGSQSVTPSACRTSSAREARSNAPAWWTAARTGSYADCVLTAVNLGDDTDTTAAVAGALAGVYYGFEAIPPKWVGQLRGKAVIDQCI